MTHEPTYTDIDEEGNDLEPDGARPNWQYVYGLYYQALCKECMKICGNRKYFRSKHERSCWRKIGNGLKRGTIPMEWVLEKMAWAVGMNKDRVKIVFVNLLHAILNTEAMKDWKAKNNFDGLVSDMRGEDVIASDHE